MLLDEFGHFKLCDFGISGQLVDSIAKTVDAGCKPYMAVSSNMISVDFIFTDIVLGTFTIMQSASATVLAGHRS